MANLPPNPIEYSSVQNISRKIMIYIALTRNLTKVAAIRVSLLPPYLARPLEACCICIIPNIPLKKMRSYNELDSYCQGSDKNPFTGVELCLCTICAQCGYYIVWDIGSTKAQPTVTYAYFTVGFFF